MSSVLLLSITSVSHTLSDSNIYPNKEMSILLTIADIRYVNVQFQNVHNNATSRRPGIGPSYTDHSHCPVLQVSPSATPNLSRIRKMEELNNIYQHVFCS